MKFLKTILLALTISTGFIACEKDHDNPSGSIEGRWQGSYVNAATGNSYFFTLQIKPGGVIQELDNAGNVIGEGAWELDPATNVFMSHYSRLNTGAEYSLIAAYNAAENKLVGDWGFDDSNTDGGTWEMTRQ